MMITPQHHPPYHHLKWGIFFVLNGWLLITAMATLSKFATREVPLLTVVFFQNFISGLMTIPWIYLHGIRSLRTERFGLIFLRSIVGLLAFGTLFAAIDLTSLVDAMLLNNAMPILLPFVIWIWKKKRINHKLWPGIAAGFLGIALILKPSAAIVNLGALLALFAAVCGAISLVAIRVLSQTERTHTVIFYYSFISSAFSLLPTLFLWKTPSFLVWTELIAIGLVFAFAQWCFMRAFHHAKAIVLGPFTYSTVIYSALFQWAIWGQVPDLLTWCGIVLICGGGLCTLLFSKEQETQSG